MNTALGIVGGLIVGAAVGVGAATLYQGKLPGMGDQSSSAAVGGPVLELDGKTFTEADLPADVRLQVFEARSEAHERVNGVLNQFALQAWLAKEKGIDVKGAMPPFEELVDVPTPTEEEMKTLFEANKARLPPETTFETIKGDIEKYVKNQKLSEVLRTKNEDFKKANKVKLLAEAPIAPIVDLDLAPYAAKGPGNAPTLVEVADYTCPHCQMTQPEVEAVTKELGDKIRFVAVPFSLKPETLSGSLARGAYCARQQGDDAFWKFHETAFRTAKTKSWKSSDPAAKEPVMEIATEAGLDTAKVDACIDSPEAMAFVKTMVEKFNAIGVTGTPTFFLDGRRLSMKGTLKDTLAGVLPASSH